MDARRIVCAVAIALVVTSAPPLASKENKPTSAKTLSGEFLTPDELVGQALHEGKAVSVAGKYKELINEALYLFDCGVPFLLSTRKLSRDVLEFIPTQDNLELRGTVVRHQGGLAIRVQSLGKGPDDITMFRRDLERVQASSGPQAGPLFTLGKRLAAHLSRHDEDAALKSFAEHVLSEAYISLCREKPDDARAQLEFVQDIDDLLKDRELTTKFLLQVGTKFDNEPAVKTVLKGFRCRKHRGKWVSYEEFKRAEGLVFHHNAWMLPAEKDMLIALEAFLRRGESSLLLLRKRTEREYEIMATGGNAEPGMNRREVHAALGFPDHVRRRASDGREFDQWCYDDELYYFFNGILVQAPEPAE